MTILTGHISDKSSESGWDLHGSMPVRRGPIRDRCARALGLARSFGREPAGARRGVCDLCRKLAQALSHHQGQHRDHALRGQALENRAQLLRAMRHAAVLRARALAAHGEHPARAFAGRTGRQPLYHIAIEELQEWAYTGEPLVPLRGFPGVVWQRSKKKQRQDREGMF
jgi:hypothetical protein